MSRKPRVVSRTVRAPRRSMIAFVTRVVPCTSTVTSPTATPAAAQSSSSPARAARAGSSGVVRILWRRSSPVVSWSSTRSVKVPPMSSPTRYEPRTERGAAVIARRWPGASGPGRLVLRILLAPRHEADVVEVLRLDAQLLQHGHHLGAVMHFMHQHLHADLGFAHGGDDDLVALFEPPGHSLGPIGRLGEGGAGLRRLGGPGLFEIRERGLALLADREI